MVAIRSDIAYGQGWMHAAQPGCNAPLPRAACCHLYPCVLGDMLAPVHHHALRLLNGQAEASGAGHPQGALVQSSTQLLLQGGISRAAGMVVTVLQLLQVEISLGEVERQSKQLQEMEAARCVHKVPIWTKWMLSAQYAV